ncbi:MAG: GNAT family N-acetyltransferase [Proteobacteria bacterium]|nr:GNAT family N-acetyltransferase [Pseudomonadota bacterium]
MIFRDAIAADIPILADFARRTYAAAFGDSMAASDLEHHLTHRLGDTYFAEALRRDVFPLALEGGLAGYAQFGRADVEGAQPGDMQLRRLYVDPGRQNSGIGSILMRRALARMAEAPRIFLDVWDRNTGAVKLYERFGFRAVGTVPFVTPSGEVTGHDLLMMLIPSEAALRPPQ